MKYFTKEYLNFFKELNKNNSTEWFNENRKRYENVVKQPFANFVDHVIAKIRNEDHEVMIKHPDAIMRINRDTRFSKDKSPYNTYSAANISKFGKKDKAYPGFYFQLSPSGVSIFGGAYMVEPLTQTKIRAAIASDVKGFAKTYNTAAFKEKYGTIQGEQSKRLNPEFVSLMGKEPLIANKQFYYNANLPGDLIVSEKLLPTLMEYYRAGKKVNDFLKAAW